MVQYQSEQTTTFADLFAVVAGNVGKVVRGKPEVVNLATICLVAEGHLLLEDVPGVGKTSLAKAMATSIDASYSRVQFTPDLLPSDLVGVTIWNRADNRFEFREGPVFNNMVLADEINRASPKTQSALLEAMAECQVTTDGNTYSLGSPFMVIATQNPLDHEGTFPLPESQLDRFLMRLSIGYPGRQAELEILETDGGDRALEQLSPVIDRAQLAGMIAAARSVHMADPVRRYLIELIETTRNHPQIALGASPRAALSLQRAARARAAASGRDYVTPDDIKALAIPVLSHRLALRGDAAHAGISGDDILVSILGQVPVPSPTSAR